MNHLSPEAQRAVQEGALRRRGYWPSLYRTTDRLVLKRPYDGGRKYQRQFADYVAENLPAFRFDARRGWWEAGLTWENWQMVREAHLNYRELQLNLSDGLREWLKANRPGVAAQTGDAHSQ